MEKVNAKIEGVEVKQAKNGKNYKAYKTSVGNFSVFSESLQIELDGRMGEVAELDLTTKGEFRNIVGVGPSTGEAKLKEPTNGNGHAKTNGKDEMTHLNCSMMCTERLAGTMLDRVSQEDWKDIDEKTILQYMDTAIKMVKLSVEAFGNSPAGEEEKTSSNSTESITLTTSTDTATG